MDARRSRNGLCAVVTSSVSRKLRNATGAYTACPKWIVSFNVAPTATVPVIRRAGAGRTAFESAAYGSAAPNECVLLRWGLVPFWAGGVPLKNPTFNARMERIEIASSFRGPWARGQRCILPAAGFYEWQARTGGKQPYFIKTADRDVFGSRGCGTARRVRRA